MDYRKPYRRLLLIPAFFVLLSVIFFWRELAVIYGFLRGVWAVVRPIHPFYFLNADVRTFIAQQAAPLWTPELRLAWGHLASNGLIAAVTFALMMIWMAQFVLPVRDTGDRLKAAWRLWLYLVRRHGPAIFVKEGKIISDIRERRRRAPGVALVDLKSAIVTETSRPVKGRMQDPNSGDEINTGIPILSPLAVLRGKKRQRLEIRAHGPGLVFTSRRERVHGAVDLRKQIRIKASPKIDAYTRDGIRVESLIYSLFSVSEEPDTIFVTYLGDLAERNPENFRAVLIDKAKNGEAGEVVSALLRLDLEDAYEVLKCFESVDYNFNGRKESQSGVAPVQPFPFEADRVIRAIYYLPYTAEGKAAVPWDELTNMVAIEEFRNKVAKYTYDYMHMPDDPEKFPLKRIKQEFAFSVRCKGMMKYQIVFRRDGKPIAEGDPWKSHDLQFSTPHRFENSQVLRDRGIKVITAGFGEFNPPPDVRMELINNWRARWEKEINSTLAHRDLEAARIRSRARVKAQRDTSFALSEVFSKEDFSEEALTIRVFQALENAATDTSDARLLPHDTINMLWSLYQWMLQDEKKPGDGIASPEDSMPGGLE
jgi:hypothetical protein